MASSIARRKRTGWVVACGVAMAGVLAFVWNSAAQRAAPATGPATYAARALLNVPPPEKMDAADPAWQRTIATQVAILNDPSTARTAAESDAVRATGWYARFADAPGAPARAAAALRAAVTARVVVGTSLIEVVTVEPAADAAVLVNAVAETGVQGDRENATMRLMKRAGLLNKELKNVEIELNEEVLKSLRQKEQELGMDQMGTSIGWNGRQHQLDLMIRRQHDTMADLGAAREAAARLGAAQKEGKVPLAIEAEAADAPQVRELRAELARVRLAMAEAEVPATAPAADAPRLARREAACRKLLAEAADEARTRTVAARAESAQHRVEQLTRQAGRDEEMIQTLSTKLAELNKTMIEYRQLNDRQQELAKKGSFLREELSRIHQFSIEEAGDLEFVQRATAEK